MNSENHVENEFSQDREFCEWLRNIFKDFQVRESEILSVTVMGNILFCRRKKDIISGKIIIALNSLVYPLTL